MLNNQLYLQLGQAALVLDFVTFIRLIHFFIMVYGTRNNHDFV